MKKIAFAVVTAGLLTLTACKKSEDSNAADNNATEIVVEIPNAVDANTVDASTAIDANATAPATGNAVAPQ